MARNKLCTSLFVLVLLIAMRAAAQESRTAVIALPQAHAYHDYHHARPLLDALAHGFCSVEADVFLVDGGSASFSWQMPLPISLPISDVSFSMRRLVLGRIEGGSVLVNKSPRHRLGKASCQNQVEGVAWASWHSMISRLDESFHRSRSISLHNKRYRPNAWLRTRARSIEFTLWASSVESRIA